MNDLILSKLKSNDFKLRITKTSNKYLKENFGDFLSQIEKGTEFLVADYKFYNDAKYYLLIKENIDGSYLLAYNDEYVKNNEMTVIKNLDELNSLLTIIFDIIMECEMDLELL